MREQRRGCVSHQSLNLQILTATQSQECRGATHVLDLSVREDPVERGGDLELGTELGGEGEALLLLCELEQVGALSHDGSSSGGHLENLLLGCIPGDGIELLNLESQPAERERGG